VVTSGTGLSVGLDSGAAENFDRVVLTTPAGVAAEILEAGAPGAGHAALSGLRYNDVAIVSLLGDPGRTGFGFQTAFDSPWHIRGVTWAGSLFGRAGACTAYLGGGLDPEIADWSDAEVADCAAGEFREIHGRPAQPLAVVRARLPAYDESWDALGSLALPDGVIIAANYQGRLGISARIAQAEELADALVAELATG
jgi:protoporphyrinogen oxidase